MKRNIKLSVILSVTLAAASFNAHAVWNTNSIGDDGNPHTVGNAAYSSHNKVGNSAANSFAWGNYLKESVRDSFLSSGLFAFPGAFLFNLAHTALYDAIFGEKEDPNKPVLDKLAEMDKKLDQILSTLRTSLEINHDTAWILSVAFQEQTKKEVGDAFSIFDARFFANIRTKNQLFINSGAYGSIKFSQLEELYNYAAKNKNYQTLYALDAVNAAQIATDHKQILRSSHGVMSTSALFANISANLIKNNTDLKNIKQLKETYKKAMVSSVPVGKDFLDYIDIYNYDLISTKIRMVEALQALFNMQLTQLAYHYATGANIPSLIIPGQNGKLPGSGLTGFREAAAALDRVYQQQAKELQKLIDQNLTPIDNKETLALINDGLFDSKQKILHSSFGNNVNLNSDSKAQCVVSNLFVNDLGSGAHGTKLAMVELVASCYTGHNKPIELRRITFPIVHQTTKIIRYPYENIYFKDLPLVLLPAKVDINLSNQFTHEDIKAFGEAVTGNNGIKDDSDKTVPIGNYGVYPATFDYNLSPIRINFNASLNTPSGILPVHYEDDIAEGYLRRNCTIDRNRRIFCTGERRLDDSPVDGWTKKSYYYLANYQNHWFTIKTVFGIEKNTQRIITQQNMGVGCLDRSCNRLSNNKTLEFTTAGQKAKVDIIGNGNNTRATLPSGFEKFSEHMMNGYTVENQINGSVY